MFDACFHLKVASWTVARTPKIIILHVVIINTYHTDSKACRTCSNFSQQFSAILEIEFDLVAKLSC